MSNTDRKPEPDEDDKEEAAKMMEAYKDKPTIVLPGTGERVRYRGQRMAG